jgi:Carboxypeptidase regulatory-like domain
MMRPAFHLAFCAALLAAALVRPERSCAQAVRGVVVDDQSLARVSAATVRVVDGDEVGQGTQTDEQGHFFLRLPHEGAFRLEVSGLGYRTTRSQSFNVAGEDTVSVEFRVSPDAVLLDPITVTAHATRGRNLFLDHMRDWGKGVFVTPFQIDSMHLDAPADVFRKMKDVKLSWRFDRMADGFRAPIPSVVSEQGRGCLLYMINRVMVQPAAWEREDWTGWQLGDLLPDDIKAVEVYRSISEVPPSLRAYTHQVRTDAQGNFRVLSNCGLVVFWTKSAW